MVVYAVEARKCAECPKVLPLECFPATNRKADGTLGRRSRCPDCWNAKLAAMPSRTSKAAKRRRAKRYRERMADPVERETLRRVSRESQKRRRAVSEDALERQRAAARKCQAKRRADPEIREAENRRRREERAHLREHDPDAWLRLCEKDRRGYNRRMRSAKARAKAREAARLAAADRNARRLGPGYEYRPQVVEAPITDAEEDTRLPIEPFLEYVESRIALERRSLAVAGEVFLDSSVLNRLITEDGALPPEAAFLTRIGFDPSSDSGVKALWRWRNETRTVELDVVDRVLTAYDEPYLLDSLYPDIDELLAA